MANINPTQEASAQEVSSWATCNEIITVTSNTNQRGPPTNLTGFLGL